MNAFTSALAKDLHLSPETEGRGHEPNQLVLLGAGMSNIQLLKDLVRNPLKEVRIILVQPLENSVYPAGLPQHIAQGIELNHCSIPLEPLVRKAGVRWLRRMVRSLDANSRTIVLNDGSTTHYDWLSINTPALQTPHDADSIIPGAADYALFLHPLEVFSSLWPQVLSLSMSKAVRIAVMGNSMLSGQMALALKQRLPHCAITYVRAPVGAQESTPETVQTQLQQVLRTHHVTEIRDRVLSISANEIQLGCGARLACDIPLICPDRLAPLWLRESGLALDEDLTIQLDAHGVSTSHAEVLICDDHRTELAANIAALTQGQALRPLPDTWQGLQMLFADTHQTIAHWKGTTLQGRSITWLKHWLDQRGLKRITH